MGYVKTKATTTSIPKVISTNSVLVSTPEVKYAKPEDIASVQSDTAILSQRITNLENDIKNHKHSGTDGSNKADGSLDLLGSSHFRIGDSIDLAGGQSPTPAYINIGGGEFLNVMGYPDTTLYSSLNIADQQDLKTAKNWGGLSVANLENGGLQMWMGVDSFDVSKREVASKYLKDEAQFGLVHRSNAVSSYVAGIAGAFSDGKTNITLGTSTLTDFTEDWDVNIFAPVGSNYALISVAGTSTNTVQVAKILSNTANTITISGTWNFTEEVTYIAYFPIVCGATFAPWKGFRVMPGGSVRGMGTGADGFIIYDPMSEDYLVSDKIIDVVIGSSYYYVPAYSDSSHIPIKDTFGDGSDGDLVITTGITDIDLGGAKTVVKNYTSISITGDGKLTFSNPHATGTMIVFNNQGELTLTSSTVPLINLTGIGSTGGTKGAAGGNNGTDATLPQFVLDNFYDGTLNTNGKKGGAGGGDAVGAGGTSSVKPTMFYGTSEIIELAKHFILVGAVGAGGGGGASGGSSQKTGGDGGRGAGSLIILSNGALNFTGTIDASGINGSDGEANETAGGTSRGGGGGGGGGAGGLVLIGVESIIANSGTIDTSGGDGGKGKNGERDLVNGNGSGGGGGAGGVSLIYGAGGTGYGSGTGGAGGLDNRTWAKVGSTGSPFPTAGYGAGGAPGLGNQGTYGVTSSSGGGGGGGGGAKGYSLVETFN